jgi:two-component sensor histidine kinase
VGLIINEVVCNCYRHAFPDGRQGQIGIEVRPDDQGSCVLTISDNGAGIPKDKDFRTANSLGLKLVNRLVQQLSGALEIHSDQGTQVSITFPFREE